MQRGAFESAARAYEGRCEASYQRALCADDDSGVSDGACRDCHGDGVVRRLIQAAPLNYFRTDACLSCGGTGDQSDADWRVDNAEAAEDLARAELATRCDDGGDLCDELCAWLPTAPTDLSADVEGFTDFLIRHDDARFWAAFERGYAQLRARSAS